MGQRDMDFGGGQRTGQRAVGVTVDHHHIGLLFQIELFQRFELAARHGAVATTADVQVEGGGRHAQLLEEHIGHVLVVVLAGVHDAVFDIRILFQGLADDGRLDELGPGTDNRKNARLGHL